MPLSSPLISNQLNNSANEYYDSSTIVLTDTRLKCVKGCSLSKEPCEHLCSWARHNKLPSNYTDRFRPLDLEGEDIILDEENSKAEEYTLPESIGVVSESLELATDLDDDNNMDTQDDVYSHHTQGPIFTNGIVDTPDCYYSGSKFSEGECIYEEQLPSYHLQNTGTINYVYASESIGNTTEITEMTTVNATSVHSSPNSTPKPTPTPRQIHQTPKPTPTPRQITDTPRASFSVRRTGPRRKNVQSDELAAMKSNAKDLIDLAPHWKVKKVLQLLEN